MGNHRNMGLKSDQSRKHLYLFNKEITICEELAKGFGLVVPITGEEMKFVYTAFLAWILYLYGKDAFYPPSTGRAPFTWEFISCFQGDEGQSVLLIPVVS